MLWPVVKALLGHYRRYPLQIILVWLGLTLSISLLIGVMAINYHAHQGYQYGEKLLSNPFPYRIRPKQMTHKIPQDFYAQLRHEGFQQCVSFDNYRFTTQKNTDVTLMGFDSLAMLSSQPDDKFNETIKKILISPSSFVLISTDLARREGLSNGDFISLNNGAEIGPIKIDEFNIVHGTRIFADLAFVNNLNQHTQQPSKSNQQTENSVEGVTNNTELSMIACGVMSEEKLKQLKAMLPSGMTIIRSSGSELKSLTKAFHLNLTAMGMLAFLVGLFIFYQAISLSFIQRQPLVGVLRQMGVSGWQLTQALLIELSSLIILSWLCGNVFGLLLANQLIPAVSASLNDLYDVNIGLRITWHWEWSRYGLYMATFGALLACVWPLIRLLKYQPIRLSTRLSIVRFAGTEFRMQAGVATLCGLIALLIYKLPQTQLSGLFTIVFMLLSVALFSPYLIWCFFNRLSSWLKGVKIRWFFADAAASMSYRGIATMAFIIAMAANIGIETMIGSFRETTHQWLEQRLAADLYIHPTLDASTEIKTWLDAQPEVESVWLRWENELVTKKGVLQIVSTGEQEIELKSLTVKTGIPNYWYYLHHSKGIMVSESMALKQNINSGDYLDFAAPFGKRWHVLGIYYDYGNPYNQVIMSHSNWRDLFLDNGNVAFATRLKENIDVLAFKEKVESTFELKDGSVFDHRYIHKQVMHIFDQTFAIANALGNITLFIAVCGIFIATLVGETSRQRHISLLRCLGVSEKDLVFVGGLQLCLFGVISLIIAIPLGLTLAHLVIDIVFKQSFGWTMQLQFMSSKYIQTALWAMAALVLAGALPILRLIRYSPIKSLREGL